MTKRMLSSLFKVFLLFCSWGIADACTISYATYLPTNEIKSFTKAWPHSVFEEALASGTGCDVALKLFSSETALRKAAIQKQVDIAYLKDFNYYLAKKENAAISPLVVLLTPSGSDQKLSKYYTGYILSLADNPKIHSINDLNGGKMGVRSKFSTSGYILPMDLFDNAGISVQPVAFQNEDTLYKNFESKKLDAVATWDAVIYKNQKKPIRILKKFENIPNPPIVITHTLPAGRAEQLQHALIALKPTQNNQSFFALAFAKPDTDMFHPLFKAFDSHCQRVPNDCV